MTDDAELIRLLNEYGLALYQTGVRGVGDAGGTIIDARTALLAYIDRAYVRRDQVVTRILSYEDSGQVYIVDYPGREGDDA